MKRINASRNHHISSIKICSDVHVIMNNAIIYIMDIREMLIAILHNYNIIFNIENDYINTLIF